MDEVPKQSSPRVSLAAALRTARLEDAERSEVLADFRTLQLARLEVLRDALEPVLLQIPQTIDMFDVGLMPGDPPRLFIDMIAFVEMSRDRRHYCLYQDRRHGRVRLAEADTLDDAVDAVTTYIARRLIERDKALASDAGLVLRPDKSATPSSPPAEASVSPKRNRSRWVVQAFWFIVETLGLLMLFAIVLFGFRRLLLPA